MYCVLYDTNYYEFIFTKKVSKPIKILHLSLEVLMKGLCMLINILNPNQSAD